MNRVDDIVPHWAQRTPDAIALKEPGRVWTYAELDALIRKTAMLLAERGVRGGDRVMILCENCCGAVALYFACTRLDAWPIVVNNKLSEREIEDIRAHSGARLVLRVNGKSDLAACIASAEPNARCAPEPPEDVAENDVAALVYTSGSTGKPKGVMLSHASLMFVAAATAKARALVPEDHVQAVLPVSHILGLTGVLLGSFYAGACVHLVPRFDPAASLKALKDDGLSVIIGTPSMYAMLAEYAARKGATPIPAPRLRLISSAGAPLDMPTKAAAEAAFAMPLHNGYGMTECGPTLTLTPLDAPRADCGIGRLLPGIEARIAGDGVGELFVRTPGMMTGYYKAPEETVAVLDAEGWLRTGDLARFDGESWFIEGRAKEMIIRFGFNVYPAEIEGVLNAHPTVARAAVIGRMKDGNEDILAFVHAA
ncbi:MAG: AMP-binding protein, partial [Alphaproteobacteria bacterium]|nr:AMP-binding protein [Alphaproteobacteria bacterium]